MSLVQSTPCVYYRSTIGQAGEIAPAASGSTEERSCGFRVRDATGSIRVFRRGALLLAPVFGWRAREFLAATPAEAVRPDTTLWSA